jgi:hypothetical protein
MPVVVVRVWLPDRPGALGQVASRIGAVRGDVVGIEILERGAGRAVDELLVSLPEDGLVDLLVAEIAQVDGVDVEDVRPMATGRHDPGVAVLDLAATLADIDDPDALLQRFCVDLHRELDTDWVMACDLVGGHTLHRDGEAPTPAWLAAFAEGFRHLDADADGDGAPDDLVWARLPGTELVVALGRKGRPFRWRERRQLALLARIAGATLRRAAALAPPP